MIEQNCQKLNESVGASKGKKSYTVKEIREILGISSSSGAKLIRRICSGVFVSAERSEYPSQILMLGWIMKVRR